MAGGVGVDLVALVGSEVRRGLQDAGTEPHDGRVRRCGIRHVQVEVHLLGRSVGPIGRHVTGRELHPEEPLPGAVDDAVELVVAEHVSVQHARPEGALGREVRGVEDDDVAHQLHVRTLPEGSFGHRGWAPDRAAGAQGDGSDVAAARYVGAMPIARYPGFVIDCPDPGALAAFYGGLLDWGVETREGWAEIRPPDGSDCISFQQVSEYAAPRWPSQSVPQQMHLDLMVEDLDAGEAAVLDRGATKSDHQPGTTFRVFLDPAGHPFCLCAA